MRMLKKLTAVILSVVMILGCMSVFANETAETTDAVLSAPSNQHARAVKILNALDILTDIEAEEFEEDINITRAEFVYYIVKLLGYSDELVVSKEALRFSDVPYIYWATPYIVYASDMGLISGYENGEFGPEDWLTYGQAVKILISTIGHTKDNSKLTDYPDSYIALASLIGLLKNVDGSANEPITKGAVVELIYNSLEAEVVKQNSYGDKEYYVKDGTMMMEQYLDVKKVKGIWNADEYRNIYGDNYPDANMIEIDRVAYHTGDAALNSDLLFKNVVCYVKLAENEEEEASILYMEEGKGNYLEISTDDLSGAPSLSKISYYEGKGNSSVSVAENGVVLLNGRYFKPKSQITATDLSQEQSVLMLYDNDRNGEYEILQIKKAETVVVDQVDAKNGYVYFKYNATVGGINYLDLSGTNKNMSTMLKNAEGTRMDISALVRLNVIEVYAAADNRFFEAIVSDVTIKGEIESVDDKEIVIGGASYRLSSEYQAFVNTGSSEAVIPKPGTVATYFLSAHGWIAGATKESAGGYSYAYVVGVDGETASIANEVRIKLYTQYSEMEILDVAPKATLDGKTGISSEEFLTEILSLNTSLFVGENKRLVKYGTNADGKLNYLDTARNTSYEASNPSALSFELRYGTEDGVTPKNGGASIDGGDNTGMLDWTAGYNLYGLSDPYRMSSKTVVFSVPGDLSEVKKFKVMSKSGIPISTTRTVPGGLDMYDANDIYRIGVAVHFQAVGEADAGGEFQQSVLIVEKVTKVADEYGTVYNKLYAQQPGNGTINSVQLVEAEENPGILNGLKIGSVISYKTNADGEIISIKQTFNSDSPETTRLLLDRNIDEDGEKLYMNLYGEVLDISHEDAFILVELAQGAGRKSYEIRGSYVRFDAKRGTLSLIDLSEIRRGDKVFIKGNDGYPQLIMVCDYD